eukprot:TRINITY_DN5582_c0_g1_i1.p1 TRINITY_DN5582_c0_g1~~TRINITY_DN5582_c0_g1_i1.p1  ORF type:complete len:201 (+),score=20.04 TRINITY_DN5582_c0_g1_i1:46-648(+)
MACGSGSACAAARALRNLCSSNLDSSPKSGAGANIVDSAPTTLASNRDITWPIERTILSIPDTDLLLEAHSRPCGSDSESSDDDGACKTPQRTATSLSMQESKEFCSFVERRLAREVHFREQAYVGESLIRRPSEPSNSIDADGLICRCQCENFEECSESDSDTPSHVSRSPRLKSIPAASEYLSPTTLQAALQAMHKKQ